MLKKTLISLATLAVVATATASSASAGSYGSGYFGAGYKSHGYHKYYGHKKHCNWIKKKIIVGYDHYDRPIYKWKRFKVCY